MHGAQLAPDVEPRGRGGRKQLMALVTGGCRFPE